MLEIVLSRVFSVLFFYHYSFFAIGLVMSGLTFGGLWAGRWKVAQFSEEQFIGRLSMLAGGSGIAQMAGLFLLIAMNPPSAHASAPQLLQVILAAIVFLPALTLTGTLLAVVLSRRPEWVGRLYAADLCGAALGCLGSVIFMRIMPGPVCIAVSALLMTLIPLMHQSPASSRRARLGPAILVLCLLGAHALLGGRLIRLRSSEEPILERWNEHSRLWVTQADDSSFQVMIDRAAATFIPMVGVRRPNQELVTSPVWLRLISAFPYRMGRQIEHAAIIGVGGGRDLLPPLASGAKHVDGFEINGSMVRLLTHDLKEFYNVADWPEVSLRHSEGRIGIRHSGVEYDSIQASQIDTWAATAAGGFVLSENGLYTLEAWQLFLGRLSGRGFLSVTRWYLPDAPAETHRLVALAVAALKARGISDARGHIALAVHATQERMRDSSKHSGLLCTIVVSIPEFADTELERYRAVCAENGWSLLLPDGADGTDPVIAGLLEPTRFDATVLGHEFDISPPTDDKPYFFLLLRPWQIFSFPDSREALLIENTMNAVRVMLALLTISVVFSIGILLLANRWFPHEGLTPNARRSYRWLTFYFLGIGSGYMFIQLAFHQRLILALGQPAYSLSVILFSMLLGGGLGSVLSERLRSKTTKLVALALIPAFLVAVWFLAPFFSRLEEIPSTFVRVVVSGGVVGITGVILGVAFPIGAAAAGLCGDWAVQRMWAVNGAASILGSSLAAFVGMILGGRAMFLVGLAFYLLTLIAAWRGLRAESAANEHGENATSS